MSPYNSTASIRPASGMEHRNYLSVNAGNGLVQQGIPLLVSIAQMVLGLLLLYSCLSKIAQYHTFLSTIYSYQMLSPRLGILAAITVPWVEFVLGVSLLGGVARAGAFLSAGLLMLMFLAAQFWAMASGLSISCGCFGAADDTPISWWTAARTGTLAVVCVACYIWEMRRNSPA